MSFRALEDSNKVMDYKREKKMLQTDDLFFDKKTNLNDIDLFDVITEKELDIFDCFS